MDPLIFPLPGWNGWDGWGAPLDLRRFKVRPRKPSTPGTTKEKRRAEKEARRRNRRKR